MEVKTGNIDFILLINTSEQKHLRWLLQFQSCFEDSHAYSDNLVCYAKHNPAKLKQI